MLDFVTSFISLWWVLVQLAFHVTVLILYMCVMGACIVSIPCDCSHPVCVCVCVWWVLVQLAFHVTVSIPCDSSHHAQHTFRWIEWQNQGGHVHLDEGNVLSDHWPPLDCLWQRHAGTYRWLAWTSWQACRCRVLRPYFLLDNIEKKNKYTHTHTTCLGLQHIHCCCK